MKFLLTNSLISFTVKLYFNISHTAGGHANYGENNRLNKRQRVLLFAIQYWMILELEIYDLKTETANAYYSIYH